MRLSVACRLRGPDPETVADQYVGDFMQNMTALGSTDAPQSPVVDERIQSLDVLRGFALFGILLVNMAHFASPQIYLGGAGLMPPSTPHWACSSCSCFACRLDTCSLAPAWSC